MSRIGYNYQDALLEIRGKIGIIKLNRPKSLNAFGGNLLLDLVTAVRELNEHPDTVFTVLTGEGRFFSSGADVKASGAERTEEFASPAIKKLDYLAGFSRMVEVLRSLIDHRKVLILAMNGPAVGGGAAWFPGVADIVLAAPNAYFQVPFSALGLVPEFGSATIFAQSMGVHRANEFLMFGRKLSAQEMLEFGIVNQIFPQESFMDDVFKFLEAQLEVNDGKSMIEAKRLQNLPLRGERLLAVYNAADALAERFVEDAPRKRFEAKRKILESKTKSKL